MGLCFNLNIGDTFRLVAKWGFGGHTLSGVEPVETYFFLQKVCLGNEKIMAVNLCSVHSIFKIIIYVCHWSLGYEWLPCQHIVFASSSLVFKVQKLNLAKLLQLIFFSVLYAYGKPQQSKIYEIEAFSWDHAFVWQQLSCLLLEKSKHSYQKIWMGKLIFVKLHCHSDNSSHSSICYRHAKQT